MSKESLYAFLSRNIAEGQSIFTVRGRQKRYGVEFTIIPDLGGIVYPKPEQNTYDVSPDPDNEEFDFLFNLETVPAPDACLLYTSRCV